jgi:hypothetical protein
MKKKNEQGEIEIVLEPIHYRLYDAMQASADQDTKLTLEDVCNAIGIEYDEPKENQYIANTKAYRKVWNIKEEINQSGYFDKTIVIDDNVYRFATEEELLEYDRKLEVQIKKLGKRRKMLKIKRRRDGQGKLLNNAGNPITPANKQFHESFREKKE